MSERRTIGMAIDLALMARSRAGREALLALVPARTATRLVEPVRRRARSLARRARGGRRLERARDALILALYARAAPAGWACAWCDGSFVPGEPPRAGLGALLFDGSGRLVARVSRRTLASDPFAAEIAALEATLAAASRRGLGRLRVHTDCAALARMWRERRAEPRLAAVRAQAAALARFELTAIPRLHNPLANRLARGAARRGRTGS
jgi:hypothetical protein